MPERGKTYEQTHDGIVKVHAENDYAASCRDGNKYHVFLNTAGRVVVEEQE